MSKMMRASFLVSAGNLAAASLPSYEEIRIESQAFEQEIKEWRRELHKIPEIMYEEFETSKFIQQTLKEQGVEFTAGWGVNTHTDKIAGAGGTGIVADIGSGEPIVLLRADIDGLPIVEETNLPFASQNPGKMHACGHDAHAAMLLGAAKLLLAKKNAGELPEGTVRLVWQPAEEGGAGAARMVDEGVLDGVSRAFALHVDPNVPSGEVGGVAGLFLAASDFFEFEVRGKGGHAAEPHLVVDPVIAASAIITALSTIIPKGQDPLEVGLIAVPGFQGGDSSNVVTDKVTLKGTIRAPTTATLHLLKQQVEETATRIALQHGCAAEGFNFLPDAFPATHNDPELWRFVQEHAARASYTGAVESSGPYLFGDDHGFYSEQVPSAYFFLGTGGDSPAHKIWNTTHAESANGLASNAPVHTATFNLDEGVLHQGAALMAHLALRSLDEMQISSPTCRAGCGGNPLESSL